MQTYQQRVIDEKTELDEKITKQRALNAGVVPERALIFTNPIYATLPIEEQERMDGQLQYRISYSEVLEERIAVF